MSIIIGICIGYILVMVLKLLLFFIQKYRDKRHRAKQDKLYEDYLKNRVDDGILDS
jgi:hemerythrin-like domain-containing protein